MLIKVGVRSYFGRTVQKTFMKMTIFLNCCKKGEVIEQHIRYDIEYPHQFCVRSRKSVMSSVEYGAFQN